MINDFRIEKYGVCFIPFVPLHTNKSALSRHCDIFLNFRARARDGPPFPRGGPGMATISTYPRKQNNWKEVAAPFHCSFRICVLNPHFPMLESGVIWSLESGASDRMWSLSSNAQPRIECGASTRMWSLGSNAGVEIECGALARMQSLGSNAEPRIECGAADRT